MAQSDGSRLVAEIDEPLSGAPHLAEDLASLQELLGGSLVDHATVFHDHYQVCSAQGRPPV